MQASFLTNSADGFAAKLDAKLKLLLCFVGSITTILLSSPLSLGLLVAASTLLALGAARPATILKVYFVSACMFAFAFGFSALIGLAVPDLMRWSLSSLASPFLRMLISINLLLTLSLSTPVQLLFARLQNLRLPVWLHIPLTVAIRFIPTFIDDCAQIRDAARLRPGKGLSGLWRGIAAPLLFRMLYSADDLAVTAELKGIGSAKPARVGRRFACSGADELVLASAVCVLGIAVLLQIFGPQFRPLPM